jgi:hypothetical protein
MRYGIELLDDVVLAEDLPDRELHCRQVGTVVESLDPGVFEIEFTDNDGRSYASLALKEKQLFARYHQLQEVDSEGQFQSKRSGKGS